MITSKTGIIVNYYNKRIGTNKGNNILDPIAITNFIPLVCINTTNKHDMIFITSKELSL